MSEFDNESITAKKVNKKMKRIDWGNDSRMITYLDYIFGGTVMKDDYGKVFIVKNKQIMRKRNIKPETREK